MRACIFLALACISGWAGSLSDAVRDGDRVEAIALLKQHSDVNAPEPDGTTALHWAVRANDLGLEPVPDNIKQSRWKRFMERQQVISAKKLAAKVGKRLDVIVDEGGVGTAKGRTKGDAPGIDGAVHITTRRALRQGEIVGVKVARADPYDLWGTAI